jgi:hypothetical protein
MRDLKCIQHPWLHEFSTLGLLRGPQLCITILEPFQLSKLSLKGMP